MKPLLPLLLACFAAFALAQEPASAPRAAGPSLRERAAIELEVSEARAFVGQTIAVSVHVRLEQRLWREQLIQLFLRQTDVAARITTPWLEALDGFEALGEGAESATAVTAVVDGKVAKLHRHADETNGDSTFAHFELVHRFVATRAGSLAIRPARLQFAAAERFVEDLLGERVPEGREDVTIDSEPLSIEVAELPLAGRPPEFTGLVGRVTIAAQLEGAGVAAVGEARSVRVSIAGDGDLRPFRAPLLRDSRGFFVRGVREETEAGRRTLFYELVPRRVGTHTIAPLQVAYFSPATSSYETAVTAAIAVDVRAGQDGAVSLDGSDVDPAANEVGKTADEAPSVAAPRLEPVPGVDVLFGPLVVARRDPSIPFSFSRTASPSGWAVTWWILLPWAILAALALGLHRARTQPERLRRSRRRTALRDLTRALGQSDCDRALVLTTFLATWLDCDRAAVIGPALPQRLSAAGVERELALRTDALLEDLCGPRFGSEGSMPSAEVVLALATEVDVQVREHEARGNAAMRAMTAAVVLALAVLPLRGQDDANSGTLQDLPQEAARLLASGDAARAFELYQRALAAGTHDPVALCFDLAACAHALSRPAEAVLWYERALTFDPMHVESRANLHLVRQQLGLSEAGRDALWRTLVTGAVASVLVVGYEVVFAVCGALQVLGAVLWWSRRRRGGAVAAFALMLVVGVVGSGVAAWTCVRPSGDPAVVLRAGVRLLAEPHERAGSIGGLELGETISVIESSPRWARVRSGDSVGWVEVGGFERVEMR